MIEHADFALYHAKARSRGRPVLFSAEHADKIRAERLMKHALRWADFERELSLVFQPIVDVVANRVTSFEALARWVSPALGRVSPADFIPVAERLGLVDAITEVLFAKACSVAQAWPETVRLSFNLSGEDLAGADAVARLSRMVAAAGLAPRSPDLRGYGNGGYTGFRQRVGLPAGTSRPWLPRGARRFRHRLLQPELRARAAAR